MVSFSFKKKDDPPKKSFGFSLKKSTTPTPTTSNSKLQIKLPNKLPTSNKASPSPFASNHEEEDDENKSISIDTVDSAGAYNKDEGPLTPKEKQVLVIPNTGNKWEKRALRGLKRKQQEDSNADSVEPELKKLAYGINYYEPKMNSSIEETTSTSAATKLEETNTLQDSDSEKEDEDEGEEPTTEDYTNIPIESFGAAMLRGMGWDEDEDNENSDEEKSEEKKLPKRSQFLGLGAKDMFDGEGRAEREYVPVKLVEKGST